MRRHALSVYSIINYAIIAFSPRPLFKNWDMFYAMYDQESFLDIIEVERMHFRIGILNCTIKI